MSASTIELGLEIAPCLLFTVLVYKMLLGARNARYVNLRRDAGR